MPRKSIEEIIEMSAKGQDVSQYANSKNFGSRVAFRCPDQPKSGTISLYYEGKVNEVYRVRDRKKMREIMSRMIKKCDNLQGEKYILWQPMLF